MFFIPSPRCPIQNIPLPCNTPFSRSGVLDQQSVSYPKSRSCCYHSVRARSLFSKNAPPATLPFLSPASAKPIAQSLLCSSTCIFVIFHQPRFSEPPSTPILKRVEWRISRRTLLCAARLFSVSIPLIAPRGAEGPRFKSVLSRNVTRFAGSLSYVPIFLSSGRLFPRIRHKN